MANRAIIYRLYPTASQKLLLTKTFGCCRFVYNRLLSVQQERYKNGEKHLSRTHANNFCNRQLKPAYPFLREVDKFALTNAIYHLEDGYQRFFKHLGNFPKYKSKRKAAKAYTTNSTNGNIKIGEQYIKLPKLGKVKAKIHRKPKEDWLLKSATVREFGDRTYQVSVLFEYEETYVSPVPVMEEQVIGLTISLPAFTRTAMANVKICRDTSAWHKRNWQKGSGNCAIKFREAGITGNSRNGSPGFTGISRTREKIICTSFQLRQPSSMPMFV